MQNVGSSPTFIGMPRASITFCAALPRSVEFVPYSVWAMTRPKSMPNCRMFMILFVLPENRCPTMITKQKDPRLVEQKFVDSQVKETLLPKAASLVWCTQHDLIKMVLLAYLILLYMHNIFITIKHL